MVFLLLYAMTIHWPEFWCEPSSIDRVNFIWWNVCRPVVSHRTLPDFSFSFSLTRSRFRFCSNITTQHQQTYSLFNPNRHDLFVQQLTPYTRDGVTIFGSYVPDMSHLFGELKARNHQIKTRTEKNTHTHSLSLMHTTKTTTMYINCCAPIPWSIENALVRLYTHRWTRALFISLSLSLHSHRLLAPIMFFSPLCAQSLPLMWANMIRRRIHWIGYIETIKLKVAKFTHFFFD